MSDPDSQLILPLDTDATHPQNMTQSVQTVKESSAGYVIHTEPHEGAVKGPTHEQDLVKAAEIAAQAQQERQRQTSSISRIADQFSRGQPTMTLRGMLPTPQGGMDCRNRGMLPWPINPGQPNVTMGGAGSGSFPDLSVYDVNGNLLYTGSGSLSDGNGDSYQWQRWYAVLNGTAGKVFILSSELVSV